MSTGSTNGEIYIYIKKKNKNTRYNATVLLLQLEIWYNMRKFCENPLDPLFMEIPLSFTTIEYRSDDVTIKLCFAFQRFEYHILVEHDEKKKNLSPNLGPEIWSNEYLISPIEISVNWPSS